MFKVKVVNDLYAFIRLQVKHFDLREPSVSFDFPLVPDYLCLINGYIG